MADFTSPEARKLNAILTKLQDDIAKVKGATSTPQLSYSSIDVNEGRGYIPVIENGEIKMRIGRQPDGSTAIVSEVSTQPPVMPYAPLCTSVLGGVQVRCQGFVSKQYADFSHVKVYRDQAYYGTISSVPGSIIVAPLSPGSHTFKLSSVNLSGKESDLTEGVVASPKQAIAEDIADGIITTLKIANEAITSAQIAADAVKNQHIDDQAVGQTQITDGAISTNKLAADSITSNKIAANSIQAVNIAAQAIQAAAIASGAVTTDKIAANAITADKIQANAITALQIAANAITSTNIQAGAIDASKLAAQLILATNQIIVGSLTGSRLVLDTNGLTQYDSRGNLALQFGAQANKSNYLTIVDPTDPTNALATIASDGSMAMSGITINGRAKLNGVDLIQFLNAAPKGIISFGNTSANSGSISNGGGAGIFEIQAPLIAGRLYRLATNNMYVGGGGGGTVTIKYTMNGTVPVFNSNSLAGVFAWVGDTGSSYGLVEGTLSAMFVASSTTRGRFLLYAACFSGSMYVYPFQMWVEDLGILDQYSGGANTGQGTSLAVGVYQRTFDSLVTSYAFDTNTNGPNYMQGAGLYQGRLNTANYYSMIVFNYPDIRQVLTGNTITKAEIYLYSYYWTDNTGGYVSLGLHNAQGISAPTTYSYVTRNNAEYKMAKPEGSWATIPNSMIQSIVNGNATGFVLDARGSAYNTATNYGQFRRTAEFDGAESAPTLRITYSKQG